MLLYKFKPHSVALEQLTFSPHSHLCLAPSLPVPGTEERVGGAGSAALSTVSPCEGQCQCQGWGYPLQGRGGSLAWVKLFLIPLAETWHRTSFSPRSKTQILFLPNFYSSIYFIFQESSYTWPLIYERINDQILKILILTASPQSFKGYKLQNIL